MNHPLESLKDPACIAQVKEYCQLAMRPQLSEAEADRLEALLSQTQSDGRLDFWFHEVDHFLDHALGWAGANKVYASINEELKARLSELLNTQETNEEVAELIDELREGLIRGAETVQTCLKQRGYDPGPVDGVAGSKTQAALIQFQNTFE